ncbi:hypothetical protein XI06_05070 [Bradyrhizobium sp. CCBAU 11434]|nr:hypothetical protein [Bradyrhizobium sp. CCBAU 11434]MDA9519744.1 hypothetical protein [Bradyrhizobium sp. CCBAU 11434]
MRVAGALSWTFAGRFAGFYIEKINAPFLFTLKATGSEFGAGLEFAVGRGWLEMHESGTYVRILPPGIDLFPRQ